MVGCDGWEGAFCRSSRKCEGKEEVLVPRRRASTSVPYLTLAGFQYLGGTDCPQSRPSSIEIKYSTLSH